MDTQKSPSHASHGNRDVEIPINLFVLTISLLQPFVRLLEMAAIKLNVPFYHVSK